MLSIEKSPLQNHDGLVRDGPAREAARRHNREVQASRNLRSVPQSSRRRVCAPVEVTPPLAVGAGPLFLQVHAEASQSQAIEQRLNQIREWLTDAKPADNEDRVFRLRTLDYLDDDDTAVQAAGRDLLDQQRADGGWSQTSELDSDPYATGTSLSALHQAGLLQVDSEAYIRGLQFLINTQHEDGSWHVKSRSKPFQTYYETGFPHGKDQFISMMASGWSTLALIPAYPAPSKQP